MNFKLVEAPVDDPGPAHWRDLVPHRADVRLLGVDAFAGHLVLHERAEGLTRLRVQHLSDGSTYTVEQPEPVHTVGPGTNPEFDTTNLRFQYTSLVTPMQSIDFDLETRERTVVKQQPVLGGYEPSGYRTERVWATAPDGTRVPVSLVTERTVPQRVPLCSTGTGPTSTASTRVSRPSGSASSTAASCSPSPTCAAAGSSAASGTRTASCCASATRSPTSSPAPSNWWRRGGRRRRGWWRGAAVPGVC